MSNTLFSHDYFMRQALVLAAEAADAGEIPVGALVVSNNRIIAKARNQTELLHDVTAHAEMIAVTAAANNLGAKYLNTCFLYVTLEPCAMCAGALAWAQLGGLIYGASDAKKGFSRFSPSILHPKTEIVSGVMATECTEIIKTFFEKRR